MVIGKTSLYQADVYHGLLCVFSKDGVMFDPDNPILGLLRGQMNVFYEIMTDPIVRGMASSFADLISQKTNKATLIGKFNHMQATAFLEEIKHEI